jgi:hypothetical protein
MSNYLAVATVTAVLRELLLKPVQDAVTGADVGFDRPDGTETQPESPLVNIFLYHVTPNAAYRNADLPTRRSDGTLVQKPQVALDLHYLLTFHGDDSKFQPQLMLGAVVSTLQAMPVISSDEIGTALSAYKLLQDSDLASQVEQVRLTPTALSLEEFSKLWSVFFQVEYSLSVAYQASVVLIQGADVPQQALPVAKRNVYVTPFLQPTVSQVIPKTGAGQPILSSSTLVIKGSHLLGDVTSVRLGNVVVTPPIVNESRIELPIPAGLQAGPLGLQVIQQVEIGSPAQPHRGLKSNVVAFVLQPVITPQTASSTQISVKVSPAAQQKQQVALLLNEATMPPPAAPAAYTFSLPSLANDTDTLTFPISGVQGGGTKYFIRVTVDGAESPLDLNPQSPTFGPTVTIA